MTLSNRRISFAGLCLLLGVAPVVGQEYASVKGVVTFGGPVSPRAVINVTADKDHCNSKGPLLDDRLIVDPQTKAMKNVALWITPAEGVAAPFPQEKIHPSLAKPVGNVVFDQPCCQFIERIFFGRVGQGLEVKNSSPVPHNVNWQSKSNSAGNLIMPPSSSRVIVEKLQADRLPMSIACNVHPWMGAKMVRVLDHPYFAVTNEKGEFEIKLLPVGKYRLLIWHEEFGYLGGAAGRTGREIEVTAKGLDLGTIEFPKPAE